MMGQNEWKTLLLPFSNSEFQALHYLIELCKSEPEEALAM